MLHINWLNKTYVSSTPASKTRVLFFANRGENLTIAQSENTGASSPHFPLLQFLKILFT
jgi:hypothetical protein